MGMDSFAPGVYPDNGSYFWVQNIANPPKCVEIFNYPVAARGGVRNLMLIPGVGEQDIKESLLKGSIRNKLLVREITILASNIDLLQFNTTQMQFLYNNGVVIGVQVGDQQNLYTHLIDQGFWARSITSIRPSLSRTIKPLLSIPFTTSWFIGTVSSRFRGPIISLQWAVLVGIR